MWFENKQSLFDLKYISPIFDYHSFKKINKQLSVNFLRESEDINFFTKKKLLKITKKIKLKLRNSNIDIYNVEYFFDFLKNFRKDDTDRLIYIYITKLYAVSNFWPFWSEMSKSNIKQFADFDESIVYYSMMASDYFYRYYKIISIKYDYVYFINKLKKYYQSDNSDNINIHQELLNFISSIAKKIDNK